jgi:hypothetical protein
MSKNTVSQIVEIAESVECLAGREVREKVMRDGQRINASTKPEKVAEWVKGAMERLDALVDPDVRNAILMHCGANCAAVNKRPVEAARARRKKYKTAEAFLEAEQKHPPAGTRLVREGGALRQFYTPRSFTRPMRCYCSLLRGLPEGETVSPTFCQCSRGFVRKYWETVLGKPVSVDLVKSCVSGADECEFLIRL